MRADALTGVLVVSKNSGAATTRSGFTVRAALAGGPATNTAADTAIATNTSAIAPLNGVELTLLPAVLLAFLSGVVLNLMPCVFPVLSIKALALFKHNN